jgi:hypothetical protein
MNARSMTRMFRSKLAQCLACALFVSGLASGLATAQDKGTPLTAPDKAQKELVELFGKVETRLRAIDKLLSDAGAGDTRALSKVGPSGIDELLKQSKKHGEEALQDIDKILEIAKQMGQQSSSSGGGQPQQSGEPQSGQSPLEGQQGNTTQRENTPTTPDGADKKPDGSKPDGEKGQSKSPKDGKKPEGEGTPKDPKASKQSPHNQASNAPPGSAKDSAANTSDTRERWGDLPQHARDVFRSEGGRDMPVQYRDWIDAYYRRLNQKQP